LLHQQDPNDSGATDADVLGQLSTVTTAPEQFRDRSTADWAALLDRATVKGATSRSRL